MNRTFFIYVLLIIVSGAAFVYFSKSPDHILVSPVDRIYQASVSDSGAQDTPASGLDRLEIILQKTISQYKGTYAVAVLDIDDDHALYINRDRPFDAASLYKLWVMAAVYEKIENGTLRENQVLSQSVPILNSKFGISSDAAELKDGTVTMTVADALRKMITVSHNYAALLLSEKVGLSNVASYMKRIGLEGSVLGTPPKTTAGSISSYFIKLYRGELGNRQSTESMMRLLKDQQINRKLPKGLPTDTVIAHKTGELGAFSHDAGIVYTDKSDYIVVILSESTNPEAADNAISRMSGEIHTFMTGR